MYAHLAAAERVNVQNGINSFYLLSLTSELYIDARLEGNLARFINHSCDANCDTQVRGVYCCQDLS